MRAKDWLDLGLTVVNTGSNMSTAFSTHDMQTQQAEAAAQRAKLLQLRERIFNIKQVLGDALTLEAANPLIAAGGVRFIELQVEHSGLSPALFEDLSDKEYVNQVIRDVRGHSQRLRSRLAPADQARVESVAQAQMAQSDLEYAVNHAAEYRDILATRATMQQYSKYATIGKRMKTSFMGCLLPIGMVLGLQVMTSVLLAISPELESLAVALALLGVLGIVVWFFVSSIKEKNEKSKYDKAKRQYDSIAERVDLARLDAVTQRFGDEIEIRKATGAAQRTIADFYGSTAY